MVLPVNECNWHLFSIAQIIYSSLMSFVISLLFVAFMNVTLLLGLQNILFFFFFKYNTLKLG